jgi:membrane-associated phospholipid phosphatase
MDSFFSEADLKKFTALGDPTFLLFVALGTFFYLWVTPERRRLAQDFALAIGLSILLTIGTKIALLLIHDPHQTPRLRSPSGHVAIATAVYGSCMMMLVPPDSPFLRWSSFVGTATFLLALAATRSALRLHSGLEIAVGFLIGGGCLAVFARSFHKVNPRVDGGQLVALLLLLAMTRFARVDGEDLIAYGARAGMLLLRQTAAVVEHSMIVGTWANGMEKLIPKLLDSLPALFE